MSDIVEVLNEIVERHDCSHPAIVGKASAEITRLTAENERLRAALEKAEGGFYNMANAIDDYDYHGPAPQCTGDIIGHREQFHRVHVEQLVKYAEECRAALGFTPQNEAHLLLWLYDII